MAEELEKTCENCKYDYEDMEGTHCRHCIHSAEERFEPKEKTADELESELKFLRQWKSDVMNDFCKYDASSVEEIAVHARNKGIYEAMEVVKMAYHNFCGYDLAFMQKYGNTTARQQCESYSTLMMYEIANEFENLIDNLEQMKGGAE